MKNILDPWSVPHFMFGAVTALSALSFSAPPLPAFLVTLGGAIAWEWFEVRIRLRESFRNSLADIALPLLAFLGVTALLGRVDIGEDKLQALLTATVIVYIFTNVIAWRARLNHERGFLS